MEERVRTLRLMAAELESGGTREAQGAVRVLLRFYLDKLAAHDSLGGPPRQLRAPGRNRATRKKRESPKRGVVRRNFMLSILREALGPLTVTQIRERMAEERLPLTRQTATYHLHNMAKLGWVDVADGPCGKLWRALNCHHD